MVDVSSSKNSITIKVESTNKTNSITTTPSVPNNSVSATADTAQYWSKQSRLSAENSKESALESKYYAELANSYIEGFEDVVTNNTNNIITTSNDYINQITGTAKTALTDIETARVDAVDNITTVKSESIASVEAKGNEVVSTVNEGIANIEAKGNEASTLVNTGIANINTAKTEAVNAVTTTKNNAVTEINKEVTDGKKELNDIIEAGGLNINDKITNCLLEVPQNIKFEINGLDLIFKAGSIFIVPYGTEDLTSQYPAGSTFQNNNFKVVDTQFSDGKFFVRATLVNDVTTEAVSTNAYPFVYNIHNNKFTSRTLSSSNSGTSDPNTAGSFYYNTTTNYVTNHNANGSTSLTTLPVGLFKLNSDKTEVLADQVFNGFGYIGSTVWVDKGVKGLIPNGRNADGTLKNFEYTTTKVLTRTDSGDAQYVYGINPDGGLGALRRENYIIGGEKPQLTSGWWFDTLNNIFYNVNNGEFKKAYRAPVIIATRTNNVITSFQPKLPVRLLTYDDIKINNPYFFGQYIWSEFAPDNLSWLKSSGQWNSGSGYQAFYDWALANANASKAGFKLSTASYTDYDFVVNTSAKTFRLPIKVQNTPLNDSASVVGNGLALGLNSGTVNFGMVLDNGSSHNYEIFKTGAYGASTQGTAYGNTVATPADYPIGVTTDPTKSGLVANLSANTNVSLYFYVGETTRDTGLINASQIASNFADKIGRTECKAYITETYSNGTSWYKVYSPDSTGKKWCVQGGSTYGQTLGTANTITFLKPFKDTNYTVNVSFNMPNSSTGGYSVGYDTKTVNSFVVRGSNSNPNNANAYDWYACGYIA